MTIQEVKNNILLAIKELEVEELTIADFKINTGEWINVSIKNSAQRSALIDTILLKRREELTIQLFGRDSLALDPRERQEFRRMMVYWHARQEDITTPAYIEFKKEVLGFDKTARDSSTDLFLDHLMIANDMPEKMKRLFFSLFMNAPKLMIIDQALDYFSRDNLDQILNLISRYTKNSKMSIINFSTSNMVLETLKARSYFSENDKLVELVID